jgi:hypothetical protein
MLLNPFKQNSNQSAPYSDIKSMREKVISELVEKEKEVKDNYRLQIQKLQLEMSRELHLIDRDLRELGVIRTNTDKKRRPRTVFKKISDSDLKTKLTTILSNGKKVSSSVIFKEAEISRIRFNQFISSNPGFIASEGNRRSCVYFLP